MRGRTHPLARQGGDDPSRANSRIARPHEYAARFQAVEINYSFYRLPEAETFAAWARRVPDASSLP
jgi:uncharacterized protein YecE (DUF72 family)